MRIESSPSDRGTLLVATPGGHLDEMRVLARHLDTPRPHVWVTAKTAHSIDVLADCEVRWVPPVVPRDLAGALRAVPIARRLLADIAPRRVVSTGAAMAVPYLTAARSRGIQTHYIESATRFAGPSLSGRLLEAVPGIRRYTQDQAWARRRGWAHLGGSVFDAYRPAEDAPGQQIRRVVVTFGGEKFPFDRGAVAARALLAQLPGRPQITWQLGATTPNGAFAGRAEWEIYDFLGAAELAARVRDADLVIAHAGVGSVLGALDAGKVCVVLPRRGSRGEHVDDHQVQLADALAARGLVRTADLETLTLGLLDEAAAARVEASERVGWQLQI